MAEEKKRFAKRIHGHVINSGENNRFDSTDSGENNRFNATDSGEIILPTGARRALGLLLLIGTLGGASIWGMFS